MKWVAKGLSAVFVVAAGVATLPSSTAAPFFTNVTPQRLAGLFNGKWGDYDNDGDLDLYLGREIYRNDGNLNFTRVATLHQAGRNGVAWGDYDRDGDIDIVVSGGGLTAIYRNNGGGSFVNIGAGLRSVGAASVAWGDYNNDGRLDLLLADNNNTSDTPFTGLYRNNGDHTFTLVTNAGFPPMANAAVSWGDIDNDSRLDVLINGLENGGSINRRTYLYRNMGDGTFVRAGTFFGVEQGSVGFGDYDNDGGLDLFTSGFNFGSYVLRVYHNDGGYVFRDINLNLQGQAFGDTQWVDFDNDGALDIFLNGCAQNACATRVGAIYRNNHGGSFTNANAGLEPPENRSYQVSWGDYDNDGDLDLFYYGLLRNDGAASNAAPATPTALNAELLPGNNVRLAWSADTDARSFAIRIGTVPGGIDVFSPPADLATGYRRIPERGPINTTAHVLPDVPPGTYYWSVQAIDAAFAGSPFGAEGTFTITNTRPTISAIPTAFTVPGRPTPPIPFTISDVETPPDDLVLAAYSSRQDLAPNANLVFAGSGANRTLTVIPAALSNGTTRITLTATDAGGLVATSRFDAVIETFTDIGAALPNLTDGASAWADYDNDGDLDIALAGNAHFYAQIFRNNGINFSNLNLNLPNRHASDLEWVDYNRDGFIDLTENGWESTQGYIAATYLFRNNFGTNSFTTITQPGITNLGDSTIDWADYDNDADFDLLVTGDPDTYHTLSGFSALVRNDAGVFTNSGVVLPLVGRAATAFGDYDNDGDLDIVMAGQFDSSITSGITKLFRNDGGGVFAEVSTTLPGLARGSLAFGDYDNDGWLDVLLAGIDTTTNRIARIYRNHGAGAFADIGAGFQGVEHAQVAWGDYDNDGFLDALVAGHTTQFQGSEVTRVYRNNAGASFTAVSGSLPGAGRHQASWGDYDADGDLDLLLGSRVIQNHWDIPTTPAAPTNLAVIVSDAGVQLSWSASPNAHSYNLRIGTASGGSDVMASHADAATGRRRVAQPGNIGSITSWRLALPNGTYFWSVQAIDASYTGSEFAPEATFTLSHPVISVITNRTAYPNDLLPPISFTVQDAETPASNLIVSVTSSNTNVVGATNVVLEGTGTNRTLRITLNHNQSGVTRITIAAIDEHGERGTQSFLLTVEPFAPQFAPTGTPGAVAWGDYDNDGDLDLFHHSRIYANNGNGFFAEQPGSFGPAEGSAAWGDYDNDGDLDLLTTGANAARVYRNEGGALFNINAPLVAPGTFGSGAWGDYDNDGDLDILIGGGSGTRIYRNQGSNTLMQITPQLAAQADSVAWGDYDRDGDLDVLLAGGNALRVYRNDRNNGFLAVVIVLGSLQLASAAWGDFDNDGDLDIAACGSITSSPFGASLRIYRYNFAAAQFEDIQIPFTPALPGVWAGAVAWADYDNDGDLDLLVTGETSTQRPSTTLYRNDNGRFVDSGHLLLPLRQSFAAWGDLDRDGDLDLALSGRQQSLSISRVFRHFHTGPTNRPPQAPAGLSSFVTRKGVRLNWVAPADPNQTGGFSYNLRVGRSPGAANVMNPMSAPDGTRRIAALGNAGHSGQWTITNLQGGTYYWSVQAIDHSLAGSPFSTEGSFVIPNAAPNVADRSVSTAEDTPLNITLTGSDSDFDPLTFAIDTPPAFGEMTANSSSNFTYRARPHYFGLDQFRYRAHDGTVFSPPATVLIQITPVRDAERHIVSIAWTPNGPQLTIIHEPWENWTIETSEDLINWSTATNFIGTNLNGFWIDLHHTNYPKRFYRPR